MISSTQGAFFDDWSGLLRVVMVGAAAYVALVVMLRIAGKRSLAKLNAFDLVVTVALGSTLASVLLSSDIALAEGLTALALLLALQFLVSWSSSRNSRIKNLVSSEPTLVYRRGFLRDAMKKERVTEQELGQAARMEGHADLARVAAIVLESDGSFSVLPDLPPSIGDEPRDHHVAS